MSISLAFTDPKVFTSGSTGNTAIPTGTQDGDLLIAYIFSKNWSTPTSVATGWQYLYLPNSKVDVGNYYYVSGSRYASWHRVFAYYRVWHTGYSTLFNASIPTLLGILCIVRFRASDKHRLLTPNGSFGLITDDSTDCISESYHKLSIKEGDALVVGSFVCDDGATASDVTLSANACTFSTPVQEKTVSTAIYTGRHATGFYFSSSALTGDGGKVSPILTYTCSKALNGISLFSVVREVLDYTSYLVDSTILETVLKNSYLVLGLSNLSSIVFAEYTLSEFVISMSNSSTIAMVVLDSSSIATTSTKKSTVAKTVYLKTTLQEGV